MLEYCYYSILVSMYSYLGLSHIGIIYIQRDLGGAKSAGRPRDRLRLQRVGKHSLPQVFMAIKEGALRSQAHTKSKSYRESFSLMLDCLLPDLHSVGVGKPKKVGKQKEEKKELKNK